MSCGKFDHRITYCPLFDIKPKKMSIILKYIENNVQKRKLMLRKSKKMNCLKNFNIITGNQKFLISEKSNNELNKGLNLQKTNLKKMDETTTKKFQKRNSYSPKKFSKFINLTPKKEKKKKTMNNIPFLDNYYNPDDLFANLAISNKKSSSELIIEKKLSSKHSDKSFQSGIIEINNDNFNDNDNYSENNDENYEIYSEKLNENFRKKFNENYSENEKVFKRLDKSLCFSSVRNLSVSHPRRNLSSFSKAILTPKSRKNTDFEKDCSDDEKISENELITKEDIDFCFIFEQMKSYDNYFPKGNIENLVKDSIERNYFNILQKTLELKKKKKIRLIFKFQETTRKIIKNLKEIKNFKNEISHCNKFNVVKPKSCELKKENPI